MTVAVSQSGLAEYVAQTLAQACQKDDIKRLRNLLRELFGKELHDLVMGANAREQYTIESPKLKEAVSRRLPVACSKHGSTQCLKVLLQRLPGVLDLDQKDAHGSPCIHLAITGHHIDTALCLIDSGANVNAKDNQGRSALHWAIVCQIPELLSRLSQKKADINCQDDAGAAPLHYAAQMCGNHEVDMYVSVDCLQHLLCLRPNVSCQDLKGRTPLMWAASAGSPDACKLLVRSGASVNATDQGGSTALHVAARKGLIPVASALVRDCAADTNVRDGSGQTPAAAALTSGKIDFLVKLVKLGASEILDDKGKSIAHVAAASGDLDLVKTLQSRGLRLWSRTLRGELPVHFAVIAKHNDVACHLLQDLTHGHPKGSVMKTCLHLGVRTNNVELVNRLLQMGADINAVLQYQGKPMSPLDVAKEKSLEECLAYVLQCNGLPASAVLERSALIVQRTVRRVAAARRRRAELARRAERLALLDRSARVVQRAMRRLGAVKTLAALRARREQERRHALETRAALVLQRGARRMAALRTMRALARSRAEVRQREALVERSARVVQRAVRRMAAVRQLRALLHERRQRRRQAAEEKSAFIIQRVMRRAAALRRLADLREQRLREKSSFVVQRVMRRVAAARRLAALREQRRRKESALVVQRALLRLVALKRLAPPNYREWQAERERRKVLMRSARIIQRALRRLVARAKLKAALNAKREEAARRLALEESSARVVQRAVRRVVAFKRLRASLKEAALRAARDKSALVVQRAVRRLVAVKKLATPRYQEWLRERQRRADADRYARVVQRTVRRVAAARRLRALVAEREAERQRARQLVERSALVVQRTLRRVAAVRGLRKERAKREEDEKRALMEKSGRVVLRAVRRLVAIKRLALPEHQAWLQERQPRKALLRRSALVLLRVLRRAVAARKRAAERQRAAAQQLQNEKKSTAAIKEDRSARLLQRAMRKMVALRKLGRQQELQQKKNKESSEETVAVLAAKAMIIQRSWRKLIATRRLRQRLQQKADVEAMQEAMIVAAKAMVIQHAWRKLVAARKVAAAATEAVCRQNNQPVDSREARAQKERTESKEERYDAGDDEPEGDISVIEMRDSVADKKSNSPQYSSFGNEAASPSKEEESSVDYSIAADIVGSYNAAGWRQQPIGNGNSRSGTPMSHVDSLSQHYSADDSDFEDVAGASAAVRHDAVKPPAGRRRKQGATPKSESNYFVPHRPAQERPVRAINDARRLRSSPAKVRLHHDHHHHHQQQLRLQNRKPVTQPDSGINSTASSTVDASDADSATRLWWARDHYAIRRIPRRDEQRPRSALRKLNRSRPKKARDTLTLPDVFEYYPRSVSDSLRLNVQLSVRRHEVYKAIAKGYNTAHTKTTASIPSFPIISPVKYLTAAAMR